MSRGTSSAKTLGSSFRDSMHDSDSRRDRASSFRSLNIESTLHSYPKTSGEIPMTYGQQRSDPVPYARGVPQDSSTSPPVHGLPEQSTHRSPFMGYATDAPGLPVPPYQSVAPLPYSASYGYSTSYQMPVPRPMHTTSGAYAIPEYARRGYTTGSVLPSMQASMPMQSGSYSLPFRPQPSRSNDQLSDDCFNIFWLFFLLGPLTWPCGMFGVCSEKSSERLAGLVSGACLVLVIIAVVVVIYTAPDDGNNQ